MSDEKLGTCDRQTITDISNLLFYAQMADEHDWRTDVIHKSVVIATLREIAGRLTALNEYAKDLKAGREQPAQGEPPHKLHPFYEHINGLNLAELKVERKGAGG